jgi:predicted RNase H-like HicB family nuclease
MTWHLKANLFRDQQTGRWVGHCLDLDLVTSGNTQDEAILNLQSVVTLYLEMTPLPQAPRTAALTDWQLHTILRDQGCSPHLFKIPMVAECEYWLETMIEMMITC